MSKVGRFDPFNLTHKYTQTCHFIIYGGTTSLAFLVPFGYLFARMGQSVGPFITHKLNFQTEFEQKSTGSKEYENNFKKKIKK